MASFLRKTRYKSKLNDSLVNPGSPDYVPESSPSKRDANVLQRPAPRPGEGHHGLVGTASSWPTSLAACYQSHLFDRWCAFFEEQGYTIIASGWPNGPQTVAEAHDVPEVFAHKHIKQVTEHYSEVIRQLKRKPAVIVHSFGGLIAQQLADEGGSTVTVAIDPSGFLCVLPLPISEL